MGRPKKNPKDIVEDEEALLEKEIETEESVPTNYKMELLAKAQVGDLQALSDFVKANDGLVWRIAFWFSRWHSGKHPDVIDVSDLVQEGRIGLLSAIKKFDSKRGCKFSTFAVPWIKQAMSRVLANEGRCVRIPVNKVEFLRKVAKIEQVLYCELERIPTYDEIAERMNVTAEKIERFKLLDSPAFLDAPSLVDGSLSTFGDRVADNRIIPVEDMLERQSVIKQLSSVLDKLKPRDRAVIVMRFGIIDGIERTLDEIGIVVGVTRERIRQIESETFKKMKSECKKLGIGSAGDLN